MTYALALVHKLTAAHRHTHTLLRSVYFEWMDIHRFCAVACMRQTEKFISSKLEATR